MPTLSLVVPTYNRASALKRTLAALGSQTISPEEFEVIVVDDGSRDGSAEMVESMQLPFSLTLVRERNSGPAAARNRGAERAEGSLFVFLDADIVLDPSALAAHVRAHEGHRDRVAAGVITYWRQAGESLWDRIVDRRMGDSRCQRFGKPQGGATSNLPFYEAWSGHLSVSRDSFKRLGGFDSRLRAFEDVEFAFRAARAGVSLLYLTEAIGYHNHPRSLEGRFHQASTYYQYFPLMLHIQPETAGSIGPLLVHEPIDWRDDAGGMILAKMRLRLMALPGVVDLVGWSLARLAAVPASDAVLRALYWRAYRAYAYRGVRRGFRLAETIASQRVGGDACVKQ